MFLIGIAILFAALVPLFIVGALVAATLWSLLRFVSESRSAGSAPVRSTRPAHRIAPVGRAAARGVN
jgi:hypothetical protein